MLSFAERSAFANEKYAQEFQKIFACFAFKKEFFRYQILIQIAENHKNILKHETSFKH